MRVELDESDFKSILDNYDIGSFYKVENKFQGNTDVYIIKTKKGRKSEKYLLKIFIDVYNRSVIEWFEKKLDRLFGQEKMIDFLRRKGMVLNEFIRTKDGNVLLLYKNNLIIIKTYIEGDIRKKYSKNAHKQVARGLAFMHKVSLNYPNDPKVRPWCAIEKFMGGEEGEDKELCSELKEEIEEKVTLDKLRKSIIHGDLNRGNFLFKKGLTGREKFIGFIDWDGLHVNYFVHDIAYFLVNNYTEDFDKFSEKTKLFLKEYKKELELTPEEKIALYYYIKYHFLRSGNKDKYKEFNQKYTEEEFLKLFY